MRGKSVFSVRKSLAYANIIIEQTKPKVRMILVIIAVIALLVVLSLRVVRKSSKIPTLTPLIAVRELT